MVESLAMIALVITAFGLMVGIVKLADAKKRGGVIMSFPPFESNALS